MSASSDNWSLSRIRWQGNTLPECCHGKQTPMNQMDWPCTFQCCLKMDTIWQQETWWTKITWHLSCLTSMRNNISYIIKIKLERLIDFHQLILNVGCTAELHLWQRWLLGKHLSSDRYITGFLSYSPRVLKSWFLLQNWLTLCFVSLLYGFLVVHKMS